MIFSFFVDFWKIEDDLSFPNGLDYLIGLSSKLPRDYVSFVIVNSSCILILAEALVLALYGLLSAAADSLCSPLKFVSESLFW